MGGREGAARKQAAAAESARAKEEQSRKGFQASAEACGASVAAMEARAKTAEAAYAKQKGLSAGLTNAVQAHISALLNQPRPAGLSECDAMKKELDDEIDHRAAARK